MSLLLLVALSACGTSDLEPFVLEGHELHASLSSKPLDDANHGVPVGVRGTPHLSADPEFVESIASFSSQGQLDSTGVRAGLFALYQGESEVGFYGLETASAEDADRIEKRLHEIWAKNVRLNRLRVHRGGRVFILVWHDGVSLECWEAVNEVLAERLATR